jgi:hypothetical protein
MTLTDVVAWVGAASGVVALIWQIATRRRSAHRVQVTANQAWLTYTSGDLSPDMVSVTANNVGAGAVTVTSWGVEMSKGKNFVLTDYVQGSTTLPHRLESGANGVWFIEAERIEGVAGEQGASRDEVRQWRAWVSLATGEKIYAKRGMPISALAK